MMAENNQSLSERELQILQLIVDGLTDTKISEQLNITKDTVNMHRRNIKRKLGGGNIALIVAKAIRKGHAK